MFQRFLNWVRPSCRDHKAGGDALLAIQTDCRYLAELSAARLAGDDAIVEFYRNHTREFLETVRDLESAGVPMGLLQEMAVKVGVQLS